MPTAIVTGASSGIGYEFTRFLSAIPYDLVLIARNLDRLVEIKKELEARYKIRVTVIPADLAQPGIAIDIHNELQNQDIVVDMLINNAGFGKCGSYLDQSWEDEADMVHVNILSLLHLTRLLLPKMIKRKHGYICNVASTAGFFPGPYMATYYATKSYIVSYTQALHHELRHSGVSVSALCPGPTATNFQTVANVTNTRLFQMSNLANAKDVVEYGYRALLKNKPVAIPGLFNKLLVFGSRLIPRSIQIQLVQWIQESKTRTS